jgi:predicted nucleic-acid-binding protein
MVVIDTNILDFLLHAMMHGDFPRTNDAGVRAQQIATFRLFLWTELAIGRVAVGEVQQHPHPEKREWLQRIIDNQLPEVWVQDDDVERWKARAIELETHHVGKLDCQLVAEAEIVGASTLLSFDKKMVRNLGPHAKVGVEFPTEHWDALAIPRGTPPKWTPAETNPLATASFWRWE